MSYNKFIILLFCGLFLASKAYSFTGGNDSIMIKRLLAKPKQEKYLMLNLPSVAPPKEAVFCRFENTLGRTFHIGVRLRVENVHP